MSRKIFIIKVYTTRDSIIGLPDLTNRKNRSFVKFEFQINKLFFSMSQEIFGTYLYNFGCFSEIQIELDVLHFIWQLY